MIQDVWLIDDTRELDKPTLRRIERELPRDREGVLRGAQKVPNLAVRLHDVTIYNNKKWLGEADIRLDTLLVHGNGTRDKPQDFYMPQTFRFSRVADGDRLPIDDAGLLIFYGRPLHFLDLFLTVSRDRKDSDDLAVLLTQQSQTKELREALGTLLGLVVAAPQAAAVTAAFGAAAILGNFAYLVLQKSTGSTIGLYRSSWIQYRDNFGIGRHPPNEPYRVKDLSFWYEIVEDKV
jgi:hypothetical protein